jgi:hypothetical protein
MSNMTCKGRRHTSRPNPSSNPRLIATVTDNIRDLEKEPNRVQNPRGMSRLLSMGIAHIFQHLELVSNASDTIEHES